jgi:hypothetical protein
MSWDLRKGSKKSGLQQRTNPTKNERGRQLGYSTLVPADQPSCGSLTGPLDAFFRVAGGWNGRPQLSPQPPAPALGSLPCGRRWPTARKTVFHERRRAGLACLPRTTVEHLRRGGPQAWQTNSCLDRTGRLHRASFWHRSQRDGSPLIPAVER